MADHTITLTAQQEARLARAQVAVNRDRASAVPPLPPLTADQVLKLLAAEGAQGRANQADDYDITDLLVAYKGADPAIQAQVKALLGL